MSSHTSSRSSSGQSNPRQSRQSNPQRPSSGSSGGNSGARVPDRHSSSGSSDSAQSRQRSDEDLENDVFSSSSLPLPSIYEKAGMDKVIPAPTPPPPLRVTKELSFVRMVKEGNQPSSDPRQAQTQPSQTTGESTGDDMQSLKEAFMLLLTTIPIYKQKAKFMKSLVDVGVKTRDCYTLKVNFLDLLQDRRYMPIALQCSKDLTKGNKEHGWLQPTAQEFLNTEFKLKDADISILRFEFLNEAKSVKRFKDYPSTTLVKKAKILGNAYDEQRMMLKMMFKDYPSTTRHVASNNAASL